MTDDWDDLDESPTEETLAWVADVEGIPEDVIDEEDGLPREGLFGDLNQFHHAWQQWKGMPEFLQENLMPKYTVEVKFATDEDRESFAELIGQPVSRWRSGTRIWYPPRAINHYWQTRYRDASADEAEKETSA